MKKNILLFIICLSAFIESYSQANIYDSLRRPILNNSTGYLYKIIGAQDGGVLLVPRNSPNIIGSMDSGAISLKDGSMKWWNGTEWLEMGGTGGSLDISVNDSGHAVFNYNGQQTILRFSGIPGGPGGGGDVEMFVNTDGNLVLTQGTDSFIVRFSGIPGAPGGGGGGSGLNGTGFVKQSGLTTTYLPQINLTTEISGILPISNGGTGIASPSLVAGSNVTISGTWPNQTINASDGGGGGLVFPNTLRGYLNAYGNFQALRSDSILEASNALFFTQQRARQSISMTYDMSQGTSFNNSTGVINIQTPWYYQPVGPGITMPSIYPYGGGWVAIGDVYGSIAKFPLHVAGGINLDAGSIHFAQKEQITFWDAFGSIRLGQSALPRDLYSSPYYNISIGDYINPAGSGNVLIGDRASNGGTSTFSSSVGLGQTAFFHNSTGTNAIAIGRGASYKGNVLESATMVGGNNFGLIPDPPHYDLSYMTKIGANYIPTAEDSGQVIITDGHGRSKIRVNSIGVTSLYYGDETPTTTELIPTGTVFHVAGTTSITSINTAFIKPGSLLYLIFDAVTTVVDGNNINIGTNFTTNIGSTLQLIYDGTFFYQVSRSPN